VFFLTALLSSILASAAEPTLPVLDATAPAAHPRRDLELGRSGEALLELVIDEEGRVRQVEVIESTSPSYGAAARGAAFGMRFHPARDADGQPVAAQIRYRWTFELGEHPPLSIDGVVRERGSKRMVANGRIDGSGPDDATVRTFTDAEGRFRLAGLAPGQWLLTARGPGMVPTTSRIDVPEDDYVDGVTLYVEPRPEWADFEVDDEIEVIADVEEAEVGRTIDKQEIVTLPGSFGDPVRAIQNLPGLSRPPFGSGQLLVRGTDPEDTAYHIDGLRVPLVFHFTAISTVVSAQMVDQVQFFPGSWGVRYGRAIGGIVDLSTDDRLPRRGRTEVGADLFQAALFTTHRLGEKVGLQMAVRRSYIDAVLNPILPALGLGAFRAPRYYDAQVHLFRKTGNNGRLSALVLLSDDQFKVLGGEDSGQSLVEYKTTFQKVRLRWMQPLGGGWRTEHSFMIGPESQGLELTEPGEGVGEDLGVAEGILSDLPLVGTAREESTGYALRADLAKGVGDGWLGGRVGVDVMGGRRNIVDEFDPETLGDGSRGTFNPAAYAEDQLRIHIVTLTSGVRAEGLKLEDDDWRWAVDPRVRAAVDLGGYTELFAAVGRFSQAPRWRALFAPEGDDLNYEHSLHRTLGIQTDLGTRWHLEVTGYHHQLLKQVSGRDDLFRFDEASFVIGEDDRPWANAGVGRTFGVETLAKYKTEHTLAWVSLSVGRSLITPRPYLEERRGDFDQPVNLTLIGSQDLGKRWRAGARARLVSGQPQTTVDHAVFSVDADTWVPISSDPLGGRAPTFFSADVRIDKEWFLPSFRLDTYLEVQNVTNRRNVEIPGYTEDYRRSNDVAGLPILPAFGLKGVW
jgi:TonB family protein